MDGRRNWYTDPLWNLLKNARWEQTETSTQKRLEIGTYCRVSCDHDFWSNKAWTNRHTPTNAIARLLTRVHRFIKSRKQWFQSRSLNFNYNRRHEIIRWKRKLLEFFSIHLVFNCWNEKHHTFHYLSKAIICMYMTQAVLLDKFSADRFTLITFTYECLENHWSVINIFLSKNATGMLGFDFQ